MPNTREKLIEVLKDTRANAAWHHWGYEESADHLIANGVTIPVRCKDCKHCEWANTLKCHKFDDYGEPIFVRENDFCSYGERRNDERKAD